MYNLLWETGHPEQTLLKSSLSLPILRTFGISPSVPHCSPPGKETGTWLAGRRNPEESCGALSKEGPIGHGDQETDRGGGGDRGDVSGLRMGM